MSLETEAELSFGSVLKISLALGPDEIDIRADHHGRALCIVAIVLFPPYPSVSKSYPGSYLLLYL